MALSLANSCSEKAREKVNKRHDLLLDKKLRDLEKIRQTVERELTFEQKAVRAELKTQRKVNHRLKFDQSGGRRGSLVADPFKGLGPSPSLGATPNKRNGRRCSLPVNLIPVMCHTADDTGSLQCIQESGDCFAGDQSNAVTNTPVRKTARRRSSLQPMKGSERWQVDIGKTDDDSQ